MKVINIPKLGVVIWDKSLDYSKLLKQVIDLEANEKIFEKLVESKNTMISQLSSTISNIEANNTDLHNKSVKLHEDNQKLYLKLKQAEKEIKLFWLGLVCIFVGNLTINFI